MSIWVHWAVISDDLSQAQLILAELPHASVVSLCVVWGLTVPWIASPQKTQLFSR